MMKNMKILIYLLILVMASCAQNTETKKQEKKLSIKDGLVTIVLPNNLLGGNTPEKMVDACYSITPENVPEGAVAPMEQMEDCYINSKGFVEEVYTEEQLKDRQELMKESALMEADFYKDSALKRVEFENEELTHAKLYIKKNKYEGGSKDSINQKSRELVKVLVTTHMGLFQIYNGVSPDEWKVHLTIYDVDTKELLYEYDYPTEEFPHIVI